MNRPATQVPEIERLQKEKTLLLEASNHVEAVVLFYKATSQQLSGKGLDFQRQLIRQIWRVEALIKKLPVGQPPKQ